MSDTGSTRTLSSAGDEIEDGTPQLTPEVILINTVAKFRDGKKWRQRFCVLSKLSPVADCLQLQVYRDEKGKARNGPTKATLSLQNFLAMESGFTLDKESQTLAIICQDLSVVLAFDNRERLLQWSVRIANNLGEGSQFLAQLSTVPPKSKLSPGPVRLHVTEGKFCLTSGLPPKLLAHWEIAHLRRYGIVDGRLVFEGGSRSGKGEGLHVLLPEPLQTGNIQEVLDTAARGPLNRGPSKRFGYDSPRKSLLNKFGEMRAHAPLAPASCLHGNHNGTTQEGMINEYHRGSVSMDPFSSRQDSDDTMSLHHHHCHSPIGQQQIPPQASALERCLSCTSKLGQGGLVTAGDLLKPSWTMDLSLNNGNGLGESHCNPNADRVSLSSHGSSGCELYYDTPMSIRASFRRSGTPTGHYMGGQVQGSCHGHVESPHRMRGCRSPIPCPHTCGGNGGPLYYNIQEPGSTCKDHAPFAGPYENYDFPRPGTHPSFGCCQNGNCAGTLQGIDWAKKVAMDRHSVASTALCSDWYDTPMKTHPSCQNCACAHSQLPFTSAHIHRSDPMENYDVPGNGQRIEKGPVGVSVNGEGKMPLVTGCAPLKVPPQQAIYAQVDKSKKTPRPPPVVEARPKALQPLYVNTEEPVTPDLKAQTNYVNLDFVASLDLYENSKPAAAPPMTESIAQEAPPKNLQNGSTEPLAERPQEPIPEKKDLGLPLRRSSSVPCKGGHANRASASSSDSGVSGDVGLFFEDGSSELGSLCLHESLPRKGSKSSPISTPKEIVAEEEKESLEEVTYAEIPENPEPGHEPGPEQLSPRHYETIAEVEPAQTVSAQSLHAHAQKLQRLQSAQSSQSTSSGTSDMSDYIETLSSCSRNSDSHGQVPLALSISTNHGVKEVKTVLKPRSGKEYSKIDRSLFTQND